MNVRTPHRSPRNLLAVVVSLLVLLGLAGAALAEVAQIRHKRPPAPAPVRHDTTFRKLPSSQLQIRAVLYDGSTNGSLTVQIKNPSKTAHRFSATGLYFIPDGDPDAAPQRLGAVGPMQLASGARSGREVTALEVPAGQTVEVALDVFCIDSHRASPSPQNVFTVAPSRMPRELARTIERRADSAVAEARKEGAAAPRPAAKSKIQSEVWRSRDANWIELAGEGTQEATKAR